MGFFLAARCSRPRRLARGVPGTAPVKQPARSCSGRFRHPQPLCFAVGGDPREAGNHLFIELVATHERIDARPANPGAQWQFLELPVPEAWRGQPILVFTIDGATTHDGWLAISEPPQK
ncbi:MAG: hypothetical protein H7343_14740 [Undibacterium sp.]|nr:hypothetical protein [Opitutaceae bacterium]